MTRPIAWAIQISTLLVAGTGLVYAWMLYVCEPLDQWAVVNHPAQPQVHALHILVAPLLVFCTGLVWRCHVWLKICTGQKSRRRSGITLATALPPMVISGYFLQVSSDETWRSIWVWLHVGVSLIWIAIYGLHMILPRVTAAAANGRRPDRSSRGQLARSVLDREYEASSS